MKLRYYRGEKGEKKYTLKQAVDKKPTIDAHYKFIKLKSVKTESSDHQEAG